MDRQDTPEVDARAAWDGRQVCDVRRCRIANKFRVIKAVSCVVSVRGCPFGGSGDIYPVGSLLYAIWKFSSRRRFEGTNLHLSLRTVSSR